MLADLGLVVFPLGDQGVHLFAVQEDAGRQLAFPLVDQGFGDGIEAVDDRFDDLRIDVLAAGPDDDVLEPALDEEVAVGVEAAKIARAEPAVGIEDGGRLRRILVVALHDGQPADEDLALSRGRIGGVDADFHALQGPAGRAQSGSGHR